jgi:hypothetical protein
LDNIVSGNVLDMVCSGYGAVSPDEQFIVISNLHNGADVYDLPGLNLRKRLRHPITTNCPQQVAFGLSGSAIICGGDNATIFVYDATTGHLLTRLPHITLDWGKFSSSH